MATTNITLGQLKERSNTNWDIRLYNKTPHSMNNKNFYRQKFNYYDI